MSSALNSLSSLSPLSLSVPAAATASSAPTTSAATASAATSSQSDGVSAQQELTAMEKDGSLESMLSASVAVGVLQILDPGPEPATGQTGISSLVNQLLAAYTSSSSPSSTNPGLAEVQAMEADGSLSDGL